MQQQPDSTSYKKSIKVFKWLVFVILICTAAAVAGYLLLPVDKILEKKLKTWLLEQGIAAEFTVSTLTSDRVVINNVAISGENAPTISRIHATYNLDSLRSKRVETLEISGLEITLTETEDEALHIAGLPSFLSSQNRKKGSGALPVLPFQKLTAKDVQLSYRGKKQTATLATHLTLYNDYTGELRITEARFPLNGDEIVMSNMRLGRATPDAPFAFILENIAHITSEKAYFIPLSATGEMTLARDNRSISGTMVVNDLRKLWTLTAGGNAQLDAGTWNLNFEQPIMHFESGIIQPDMFFPVLRGAVSQATGAVSFKGSMTKAANAPMSSQGQITFGDLAATVKDIPISGVNGTVALSSLYPPATKGKQTISAEEIVLGLPLKNGQMTFTLHKGGKITFFPSNWEWANGKLHTAETSLNIYKPALPDITLSAKGLALEELLSGLLQQGISATGHLSGTIPLYFTKEGDAMIRQGKLATDAAGIVRYNPTGGSPLQKGSSFQTDILLSAIENFHYESVTMTINSKSAEELEVLLHVKGRNPELYDGQTIELNINLTGNLLDIVQSGMDIYTLPERMQEQLMQ